MVASVQTSRSVSGARFLPFDTVAQEEEKTQLLTTENVTTKAEDEIEDHTELDKLATPPSTEESIIDKLDRVQSELSSRILTTHDFKNDSSLTVVMEDKIPLNNTTKTSPNSSNSSISPPPVVIRKFQPYAKTTTVRPTRRPLLLETAKEDDVSKFLPANFKPRFSNSRRKTTTEAPDEEKPQSDQPQEGSRNLSSGRSIGNNKINKLVINDDITSDLLPKGYKQPSTTVKAITIVDDISAFLPKGYKLPKTTEKPIELVEDIAKLLPPGFKLNTTEPKPSVKPVDASSFIPKNYKISPPKPKDLSALLPPGYKLPVAELEPVDISAFLPPGYKLNKTEELKPAVVDITALLPPGYKLNTTEKPVLKPVDDISAFLPPGYKLTEKPVIKPVDDIAAFLPPGFKPSTETTVTISPSTTVASAGSKVVFPSRPGSGTRKPFGRTTTTARPLLSGDVAPVQGFAPTIRKGPPTR